MLKDFAKDLKTLREKKNISLSDIYLETRVHTSVFEKIEEGNFSFQPQTYIRAFLRQYSKVVDVDPEEVLRNYDLAKSGKYRTKMFSENEKPEEKKSPEKKSSQDESKTESASEQTGETPRESEPVSRTESPKRSANFISISANRPPETKDRSLITPLSSFYQNNVNKESMAKLLKYGGYAIVLILIIVGGYFLVKSMFLTKSGNTDKEIVRQNSQDFNKVVEENEKKILGKRSEEEIQDSIRKAQFAKDSLDALPKDTLKLSVEAKKEGRLIVLADDNTDRKVNLKIFKEGDKKDYKGKSQFLLTSKNINNFIVKLNGKRVDFKDDKIEDLKIDKSLLDKKSKDKDKDKKKDDNTKTDDKGKRKKKTD